MLRSRRKMRVHTSPEISLTPLIDTALVLLVIFIIATPMMHNSLKVNLPKGYMKEEQQGPQAKDLVISINVNKEIMLNGKRISLDNLIPELEQKIDTKKDQQVFIYCDEDVLYGFAYTVADSIKYLAGIEHVVFLSAKKA